MRYHEGDSAMKRCLSVFLSALLLLTAQIGWRCLPAEATSRTAADVLSWCESQVGRALDWDGAYGAQCVDLIYALYNYLGVSPVGGNAVDYTWNTLPAGWQRLQGAAPQPGDILVYNNAPYGHVGIYASASLMYHQAPSMGGYVMRDARNYKYYGSYWGVIRPNYTDGAAVEVLTVSGVNYPVQKRAGEPFEVFGVLSSPYLLTSGQAIVYDSAGNQKFGVGTYAEHGRSTFNLHDFNSDMTFASLPAGQYSYVVDARDARGYYVRLTYAFTVGAAATTSATAPTTVAKHDCDSMAGTAYTWDEGVVTKQPTSTADGVRTYTCRECGAVKTSVIPATGYTAADLDGYMETAGQLFEWEHTAESWAALQQALGRAKAADRADADAVHRAADGLRTALEERVKVEKASGDMNRSGSVTISDVMAACRVIARASADGFTQAQLYLGDMNGDDSVSIVDVMLICRVLATGRA